MTDWRKTVISDVLARLRTWFFSRHGMTALPVMFQSAVTQEMAWVLLNFTFSFTALLFRCHSLNYFLVYLPRWDDAGRCYIITANFYSHGSIRPYIVTCCWRRITSSYIDRPAYQNMFQYVAQKWPLPWGQSRSPSNARFLWSTSQTASRSAHDRHTDRPTQTTLLRL